MSTTFEKGYALLIGVNEQLNPDQASNLPATANDVTKLQQILIDPEKSGYDPDKVQVLLGNKATRLGILKKLIWLKKALKEDTTATAIVYFSGHGYRKKDEDKYYLIPYDFDIDLPDETALEDRFFSKKIGGINAQRMLLLLDCCHAGETGAVLSAPEEFTQQTAKLGAFIDVPSSKPVGEDEPPEDNPDGSKPVGEDEPPEDNPDGSKPVGEDEPPEDNPDGSKPGGAGTPGQSTGAATRAVLVSSRGSELSYIHKEAGMSVFTYHLVEALNGHGKARGEDTTVNVLDLMSHVLVSVPGTTAQLYPGRTQTPNARYAGENFPIALLMGGKGIPEGPPAQEELVRELAAMPTVHNEANVSGDDNIVAQGNSGDVVVNQGNTTNTNNAVHNTATGEGAVAGSGNTVSNINKSFHNTGTIGDGNAIGDGNTVDNSTTTTTTTNTLREPFQQIQTQIDQLPMQPAAKAEVKETVQEIEKEVAKGEQADSSKMVTWMTKLKAAAPAILGGVADIIQDPKHAIADGIRLIAGLVK